MNVGTSPSQKLRPLSFIRVKSGLGGTCRGWVLPASTLADFPDDLLAALFHVLRASRAVRRESSSSARSGRLASGWPPPASRATSMPLALASSISAVTSPKVLLACENSATPEVGSPQTAHLAALGSTFRPQKGHGIPPGPAKPWRVSSAGPRTSPFLRSAPSTFSSRRSSSQTLARAEQVDIEQGSVAGFVKLCVTSNFRQP